MGRNELDMVTKAEDGLAHFREAIDARLAAAHRMLYSELIGCWMKSPASMVQTPGFAQNGMSVSEVISDHFAGSSGEADEAELLSIIASVTKKRDENGERDRKLMDSIDRDNADFNAEEEM